MVVAVTKRLLPRPTLRSSRRMNWFDATEQLVKEVAMIARNTDRSFGDVMFGSAVLGDRRRTRRLVSLADQLCKHPGGTLPEKLKSPKDLKALYRLCDCDAVTHQALLNAVR